MNQQNHGLTQQQLTEQDKQFVWHHLTQHKVFEASDPLVMVSGEGIRLKNNKGDEFLDATAGGVWTVNVGYGRERIAQAVYQQLVKMPYYAGTAGSEPGAKFAQELIALLPGMQRVYYSNSGSEANEKAYKIVRQRAHFYNGGKKHKIIFRDRDYHGTTIATFKFHRSTAKKRAIRSFC